MDDEILLELASLSKSTFLEQCIVPLKFMWLSSGEYQYRDVYGILKESRAIEREDQTIIIDRIPLGRLAVYIDYNDRFDINILTTDEEKSNFKIIAYYNTDNPMTYNVELSLTKINYFMSNFRYPESQRYIVSPTG